MPDTPTVRVGQQYADTDPRNNGRTLEVVEIVDDGRYAYCKVLTNPHAVQRSLDAGRTTLRDTRGRITRIRTDRLCTAYQLINIEETH